METFVTENFPWIIAAGALILLTIIGYFAEKTDFGKKRAVSENKENKKKKKEKDGENKVQPIVQPAAEPVAEPALNVEAVPAVNEGINLDPLAVPVLAPAIEPVTEMETPSLESNLTSENRIDMGMDSSEFALPSPEVPSALPEVTKEVVPTEVSIETPAVEKVAPEATEMAVEPALPEVTEEVVPTEVSMETPAVEEIAPEVSEIVVEPALSEVTEEVVPADVLIETPEIEEVTPEVSEMAVEPALLEVTEPVQAEEVMQNNYEFEPAPENNEQVLITDVEEIEQPIIIPDEEKVPTILPEENKSEIPEVELSGMEVQTDNTIIEDDIWKF